MITKPTFLVDEKKCRANIQKIADKAKRNNVEFRAHFKTHQSLAIGRWFKDAGVNKITVSSLDMAKYFASEWNDITVAFPVNFFGRSKSSTELENFRKNTESFMRRFVK